MLGWSPDVFWAATPAELAGVLGALAGEAPAVAGADELRRLMEMYPDG
ncbi:phage tail assembly chaperone [Sphingomonas sp. 1P06PA]